MDKNRNLQWIFLIFVICGHVVICQKLNETENLMRLRDCGNEFLPRRSPDEKGVEFGYFNLTSGWLLWTSQLLNITDYTQSAAFPISNRHVFTSSQVVLNKDKKWAVDGLEFKECNNSQADLPDHVAQNLTVLLFAGTKSFKVLRGRMFACDRGDFDIMYTPLLLEITPLNLLNIPCLADDESDVKIGAEADAYGLDGGIMKHHKIKVDEYTFTKEATDTWIYTKEPYRAADDRGGPLVQNVSGKATVNGLKASPASDRSEGNYFYSIPKLREEICEYSGVCFVKNFTEAIAKLPTTKPPETPEDSGTPRRPSPDSHEPKERKRPTYSEEVEPEESESAEDEEDTDILLSKDFFTGETRRKNLNIFIIVFVFVLL